MVRHDREAADVDRKNRPQLLEPIPHPLPAMLERSPRQSVLTAQKSPAYAPVHAVIDPNLPLANDLAPRTGHATLPQLGRGGRD